MYCLTCCVYSASYVLSYLLRVFYILRIVSLVACILRLTYCLTCCVCTLLLIALTSNCIDSFCCVYSTSSVLSYLLRAFYLFTSVLSHLPCCVCSTSYVLHYLSCARSTSDCFVFFCVFCLHSTCTLLALYFLLHCFICYVHFTFCFICLPCTEGEDYSFF